MEAGRSGELIGDMVTIFLIIEATASLRLCLIEFIAHSGSVPGE